MIRWVLAITLGVLAGWLAYHRSGTLSSNSKWLLSALRASALALVAAMLLGAPAGPAHAPAKLVAIDASLSWMRGAGNESATVARFRKILSDSILPMADAGSLIAAFGDSLRELRTTDLNTWNPADSRTLVRTAVDRAAASGAALLLVTDGDVEDAAALQDAPAGSQVVVISRSADGTDRPDVGVVNINAPESATAGDSIEVTVDLQSGGSATQAGQLSILLNNASLARVPVSPMAPYSRTRISVPFRVPRAGGTAELPAVLSAVAEIAGDGESKNDTLAVTVDIKDQPSVVAISTAPDLDWREALTVLRNGLDLSVRAYLRVAPGTWRVEGALTPVSEAEVRRHALAAGMLVLHGDTSWVRPSTEHSSSRVLWVPAPVTAVARAGELSHAAEWYVSSVPPSPLSGALAGLPIDSLQPVTLATTSGMDTTRRAEGQAKATNHIPVLNARLGKSGVETAAITANNAEIGRSVVISGSGYAGWALRGGRSQQAFMALFGSVFDWVRAGRGDERAVRPADRVIREGENVRWHRSGTDTLVRVVLTRLNGPFDSSRTWSDSRKAPHGDSLTLVFASKQFETRSAPVAAGVYQIESKGGNGLLVVNPSFEWVPQAPVVKDGFIAQGASSSGLWNRRLVESGWPFIVALVLLCIEWLGRRSVGRP